MFLVLYSNYHGVNFFDTANDFKHLKKLLKEKQKNFILLGVYFKKDLPPNLIDFFV